VTGIDEHASTGPDGRPRTDLMPGGAMLVDTEDWSVRVLDANGTEASVGSDAIAVSGWRWDAEQRLGLGLGLTIYGFDGSRRAHLFPGQFVAPLVVGRRVFVSTRGGYTIVSTRTGSVLRKIRRRELPRPLLGIGADS
jgi:hypothetical protein